MEQDNIRELIEYVLLDNETYSETDNVARIAGRQQQFRFFVNQSITNMNVQLFAAIREFFTNLYNQGWRDELERIRVLAETRKKQFELDKNKKILR